MTMLFVRVHFILLTNTTIKATVILAVATIIAVLLRRASASARHLAWALGLVCVLFLPILSWNLPGWVVPVVTPPTHVRPAAATVQQAQAPPLLQQATIDNSGQAKADSSSPVPKAKSLAPSSTVVDAPIETTPAAPHATVPVRSTPWRELTRLSWAAGAIWLLAQMALGLRAVRRVAKPTMLVGGGPLAEAMQAAAAEMGVERAVRLRQATSPSQITVPLTYGALRPVIILPFSSAEWPAERLRAALLHEMAHIKRHDWALQMLGQLAVAVYWFHPLIWLAASRMRSESEAACDDLVLNAGMPAQDYAHHLLDVALSVRDASQFSVGAVAMAHGPKVEGRLRAVLAIGAARRPLTRRAAACALIAAVILIAPVAAFRLIPHGPPVRGAENLQLRGNFTLRYAVTITNDKTTQAQFREYQQLRADYAGLLKKDPYYQPVPAEFYAPFSYFLSRRPRIRHVILTVSSQNGQLLLLSEEGGHTFALVYNGRNGTQLFSDGHAGRVEPGLQFAEMTNCPLPGVGIPYVPLIKDATLVNSSQGIQTWNVMTPSENGEVEQGKPYFISGFAHAVRVGATWKVLDVDTSDQRFQFLQHMRFQGQWIASHMTLTQYKVSVKPGVILNFASPEAAQAFLVAHRTPTSTCDYRLLSAHAAPLDLSAVGMKTVSAAPSRAADTAAAQAYQLDDLDVQEALHLRWHLLDWANSHHAILQQMAEGQPNEQTARARVAASLAALPFPLWQGDMRPNHVWDGDPRVGHNGRKSSFIAENLSSQNSAAHRDFEVARSRNPGAIHTVLWASGRITIATASKKQGSVEAQREIVTPFLDKDVPAKSSPSAGYSFDPLTSTYQKQLPGHVIVRLTAISDRPWNRTRWWDANGAPLANPPTGITFSKTRSSATDQSLTLVFHVLSAPLRQELSLAGWDDPRRLRSGSRIKIATAILFADGQPTMAILSIAPASPGDGTVRVGVAAGAWRTAAMVGTRLGRAHSKGGIAFSKGMAQSPAALPVQPHKGFGAVSVIDHLGDVARRVVAVDRKGNQTVLTREAASPDIDKVVHCGVYLAPNDLLKNLKELRLQTRPYSWAEFQNVRLKPTTAPKTKVVSVLQAQSDAVAHHIALGQQLQRKGQFHDGIPEFRKAVALDPNNAEAQLWLALALDEINNGPTGSTTTYKTPSPAVLDEAISHMQKAVALRPKVGEYHFVLGTFLAQRNKDSQAAAQYRRALRLLPEPPSGVMAGNATSSRREAQTVLNAHEALGDALFKMGQKQGAAAEYRQALKLNPADPSTLLDLGNRLNRVGDRAQARAA